MGYTGDKKREYNLAWVRARRESWIESKGGKCAQCESTENLEVDHIDRSTKRWTPASIWSRNEADREAELVKCQVLCSECHKKKSASEMSIPCSSRTAERVGCGCTYCKEWSRRRTAVWRASKN